jgi:hypothetical protein
MMLVRRAMRSTGAFCIGSNFTFSRSSK